MQNNTDLQRRTRRSPEVNKLQHKPESLGTNSSGKIQGCGVVVLIIRFRYDRVTVDTDWSDQTALWSLISGRGRTLVTVMTSEASRSRKNDEAGGRNSIPCFDNYRLNVVHYSLDSPLTGFLFDSIRTASFQADI